jgi:cytochrome c-type biogenesis protein CcmH
MKHKSIIFLLIILFGLTLAVIAPVSAQGLQPTPQGPQPTPSDNEVNSVAKEMYCPVCENIPLDVCPTTACQEWRELIRLKLSEGWSDQQIKDYFAVQYGDRVLAEPPRRGLNWLVYILPVIFFLVGTVIVFNVMRSMRGSAKTGSPAGPTASPPAPDSQDDPYLAKLEEELRKQRE